MHRTARILIALVSASVLATPRPGRAQQPAAAPLRQARAAANPDGKKILGLADIGRWNRIANVALSPDGKWMTYVLVPNDGDPTLHIRQTTGTRQFDVPVGSAPTFSDDSRHVGYFVAPPTAGAAADHGPAMVVSFAGPPKRFELLDLQTGQKYDVPDAKSFKFSKGAKFVAVLTKTTGPSAPHKGTDLLLRDLTTGLTQNIGNVTQYDFDAAGRFLAYLVDAAGRAGNGVYLIELATNQSRVLNSAPRDYGQLVWSDEGAALAVLRGETKPGNLRRDNMLLVWPTIAADSPHTVVYDPAQHAQVPAGEVISELRPLHFTRDLSIVYVGLKAQAPAPLASGEPRANVDIWHWKDSQVQSVQAIRLPRERRATRLAAFTIPSRTLVPLADSVMTSVAPTADPRWALGRIDTTYRGVVEWGGAKADYYRVNTVTGTRTLIDTGLTRTMGTSPNGRWFLYLKDKHVFVYDLDRGRRTMLAAQDTISFLDMGDDHPYETPTYGVAGWSADGRSVILNHRYDLFQVPLDGGRAANLTRGVGTADEIEFRLARLHPPPRGGDGDDSAATTVIRGREVDLTRPLLLSAYGEWTKKSGYYALAPGAKPTRLIYENAQIGQAVKAEDADRVLFTKQTFREFPDYWVTTSSFASPRRVTHANPFITEYAWGSRILVDFHNSRGQRLQGTLTLPANYQPGKRYPMLVYIYERLSNTEHTFPMPIFDDRPHFAEYASDGYLVFEPDIVYETGKPGTSALDCVTSGVQKIIAMGYADPDHIGLQGHSWGGYESAYILTHSHLFAAVVTAAPPVDLEAFYDETYPGTGTLQQGIVELGQVRMGTNPWDSPALFAEQSPITHVRDITTPFLIMQGTADNVVDWHQGLALYAAARRWGKQVIFLSYPDERHHLVRRANQIDFQRRMKQFFDHYLKGAPAPSWITNGIPQSRKGTIP